MNDHQGKNTLVLSPPPVPGIPHPGGGGGGSKHPFYSPREVQSAAVSLFSCQVNFKPTFDMSQKRKCELGMFEQSRRRSRVCETDTKSSQLGHFTICERKMERGPHEFVSIGQV